MYVIKYIYYKENKMNIEINCRYLQYLIYTYVFYVHKKEREKEKIGKLK